MINKKIKIKMKIIVSLITILTFVQPTFAFQNNQNNQNNIFLFVSLGMPDSVLSQYLKQAKQYHIPVVIRGLYTAKNDTTTDKNIGSFSDTANRVLFLLKNENDTQYASQTNKIKKAMGGVLINPLLFESFNIRVVPALVVTQKSYCVLNNHEQSKNMRCSGNDFDVVYGNIPIKKQLALISEKSNNSVRSEIAKSRLNTFKSGVFSNE